MKSLLIVISLFAFGMLALHAPAAVAAPKQSKTFLEFPAGTLGLGVNLGEPVGARANYFFNWKRAVAVSAGYSFSKALLVSADYLFYFYGDRDRLKNKNFFNSLFYYMGPGVLLGYATDSTNSSFLAGPHAIVGAEYLFESSRWAVRAELGGGVYLAGRTGFQFHALLGLTYYMFGDKKKKSTFKAQDPTEYDEFE